MTVLLLFFDSIALELMRPVQSSCKPYEFKGKGRGEQGQRKKAIAVRKWRGQRYSNTFRASVWSREWLDHERSPENQKVRFLHHKFLLRYPAIFTV
jgi:hypothetical protein